MLSDMLPSQSTLNRAASASPNDVDVQIAAARLSVPVESKPGVAFESAKSLIRRFPNDPVVLAASIRLALRDAIPTAQSEDENPPLDSMRQRVDLNVVREFVGWARRGERLNPTNAFFPMMDACGEFELGHRAEAVSAVLAAGQCSVWQDYVADQSQGYHNLSELVRGVDDPFSRFELGVSTTFDYLTACRNVASHAAHDAGQMETDHRRERALAIRMSLLNVGRLMRVQSSPMVGALVGNAIVQMSMRFPNGEPLTQHRGSPPKNEQIRANGEAALARAISDGAIPTADAPVFRKEIARAYETREILSSAFMRSIDAMHSVLRYLDVWMLAQAALNNALAVLLLGLIVTRLSAIRKPREPRGPRSNWAVSAILGALIWLLATVSWVSIQGGHSARNREELVSLVLLIMAWVISIAAALYWWKGLRVSGRETASKVFWGLVRGLLLLGVVSCAVALIVTAVNLSHGPQEYNTTRNWLAWLQAVAPDDTMNFTGTPGWRFGFGWFCPLVLLALSVLWCWARRTYWVDEAPRFLRVVCAPMVCLLVLLYGGLTIRTVRETRQFSRDLDQRDSHEGPYYARLLGMQWPE